MDKPNNHAGKGTFYIAWTGPAPEGHRTLLPIVPMGLTVCSMERDPDAPVWRANYCLAPYSVSVLFFLALVLLTGRRQSPATNLSPHTTLKLQATGEPRWSILRAHKIMMEIAFAISELVLLESRLPRASPWFRVSSGICTTILEISSLRSSVTRRWVSCHSRHVFSVQHHRGWTYL